MPLLCGLLTAVVHGSRSALWDRNPPEVSCAVYAEPLSVSSLHRRERAACRRSAFPPTSASHPARYYCHSLPVLAPSLWPDRSQHSSANVTRGFALCSQLEAIRTPAHIAFPPLTCPYGQRKSLCL
jgi:hypothetical protein